MIHYVRLTIFCGAFALCLLTGTSMAQGRPSSPDDRLVVVELFQSQGCSSCPPAEANLNAIAGQRNVLALSYGVTYWDDLGWKDTFAKQDYTDRQWAYAKYRQRNTVWTPQVYVDGHVDLVGTDRTQLDRAIANEIVQGPPLTWDKAQLIVGAGKPSASCDVWLVRYDPRTINVSIGAGENSGRTLPHRNVVRELIRLGQWDGTRQSFVLPAPSLDGLATAALVQQGEGGDIIAAAKEP